MPNVGPYYRQDSMYWKPMDQVISEFNEFMAAEGITKGLVMHKEVCPECRGEGRHVNRSIDGNGLDPNDPDLDDEFWENYHSGVYDVVCEECRGKNVVDVIDREATDPEVLKEWDEWVDSMNESIAVNLAEMRMGA